MSFRRSCALTRLFRVIAIWTLITLAWCAFVIVLAGRLHAQTSGCYVIDRFQQLCIPSDGRIFVDVAGADRHSRRSPAAISPPGLFPDTSAAATHAKYHFSMPYESNIGKGTILAAQQRDEYQQWIHDNRPSCCDHRDCAPARVEWTPHGWKVAGADNLIAEKQVIAWPFSHPYACVINRYVRCLFLNNGG